MLARKGQRRHDFKMGVQARRRSPLERFRCFETTDVDEARQIVGEHFCSHRLDPGCRGDGFDACQNRAVGQHVSVNFIRYGADVTIDPGELTHFYLVQVPIRGCADISNGRQSLLSTPSLASVLNPDRHTKMRWHAGCEQVLLQVDKDFLQSVAEELAGVPLGRVRFSAGLDLQAPGTAGWGRLLRGLVSAAERGDMFGGAEKHRQGLLEKTLVGSLLESQPNTASPMLETRQSGAAPAILKRAKTLIRDRFQDDIGLIELSAHAGTTPRNLQLLFKREFDASPLQVLQETRLRYARHLLVSDGGKRSIAEIAEASGHRHFGRFSVAYKKRFGESPRETRSADAFG